MTADSSSQAGFTTDPGIRLLTKIGDFVEPLTRFDRGHLTLESSQHVSVDILARQAFRVVFETVRSEGNGGLPSQARFIPKPIDRRLLAAVLIEARGTSDAF